MIKMQLIGHLGRDCTTNVVNGKSVMNFTVAHSEKFRDAQGNMKDKTVWVDCAYWSDRTAIAPYLKKGTQIFAEGIPDLRTYTKTDGSFGASLTLRVLNVQLLGGRPDSGGSAGTEGYNQGGGFSGSSPIDASAMNDSADDLPF
jgi:single-strand DNA-binding protein